jgi:hypothetical protein
LLADGRSVCQAAPGLGPARKARNIRRFDHAVSPEELAVSDSAGRRANILDGYELYLRPHMNLIMYLPDSSAEFCPARAQPGRSPWPVRPPLPRDGLGRRRGRSHPRTRGGTGGGPMAEE